MKRIRRHQFIILTVIIILAIASVPFASDPPHTPDLNVTCASCHNAGVTYTYATIDNTPWNEVCWGCHDFGMSGSRFESDTHSAISTGDDVNQKYWGGTWTNECRICHNPHTNEQARVYQSAYPGGAWLYTGTIQSSTYNTITESGATWDDDEWVGRTLQPQATGSFFYMITNNTSDTLVVAGSMWPFTRMSGGTFAISYGKLIRAEVTTRSNVDKFRTVKFLNSSGASSFADGTGAYDGICEVCHSLPSHFRRDGSGSDQLHANIGGEAGKNCMQCHAHTGGFGHGKGGGGGGGCEPCHGHDAGYEYSPGEFSQGKGTHGSHSTHTENDADDLKGPNISCSDCHDTADYPYFKSGTDDDSNGKYNLAETDVCDTCHSKGGSYDGVDDPAFGAKNNWSTGVYVGNVLRTGKEKWCATCHDESPSTINLISAPAVIGNETAATLYGTGYGYYKTGHGLDSSETYPSSGGLTNGAGKECNICHDYSLAHTDGLARTFDCSPPDGCDSTEYREGYRLKLVDGLNPLTVPRGSTPIIAEDFRLCFTSGCHIADKYIVQSIDMKTNFRDEVAAGYPSSAINPVNDHAYHLGLSGLGKAYADWSGATNTHPTCPSCHNVHGSTQLSMVRDGSLVGWRLEIYYNNGEAWNEPSSTTLAVSNGTVFGKDSSNPFDFLCASCHNPAEEEFFKYDRTAPTTQNTPTLDWTGETNYTADGVHFDSAPGGSNFVFRVKYTDSNYEYPRYIQVWVDENDNGIFNVTEKYDMFAVDSSDMDTSDGKLYRKTLMLEKAGDGDLYYRFYATDGKDDATGAPVFSNTVTIENNIPVLDWAGGVGFESDGVSPNGGSAGDFFTFRVKYTDLDGDAPTTLNLLIDGGSTYTGAMAELDPGDTDYTDGKIYNTTAQVASGGAHDYRFEFNDGTDAATGAPASNSSFTANTANAAPTLDWPDAGAFANGVDPDIEAEGYEFEFRVKYTDAEGDAPSPIEVWVDENDNGIYNTAEKYSMTALDAGDSDYTEGTLYAKTLPIAYAGDGNINYRFFANDGVLDATGAPISNSVLPIINTITVDCDDPGTRDYDTIQAAIDSASDGDYIHVYDGTCSENIDYKGKAITVRSVNGALSVKIQGLTASTNLPVVKFATGEGADSVLDGFTIDNQAGPSSATRGITISSASPTIRNCKIVDNHLNYHGAGIYIVGAVGGATIDNTTIGGSSGTKNVAYGGGKGGAIYYEGPTTGRLLITNSTIMYNEAYIGGGLFQYNVANTTLIVNSSVNNNGAGSWGGGIWSNLAPLSITGSHIDNNNAGTLGGGVGIIGASAYLSIEDGTIDGNSSGGNDGGIHFISDGGTMLITNSTVNGNSAGATYSNGGIHASGASMTAMVINSTVSDNTAGNDCGGICVINEDDPNVTIEGSTISGNSGATGGIVLSSSNNGTFTIRDSRITGNTGTARNGGLRITGGTGMTNVLIERTLFAGNSSRGSSGSGGGFFIGDNNISATVRNCTVTGNKSDMSYGGGMRIQGAGTTVDIIHCTVSGNLAVYGGGMYVASGTVNVKNSIFWGNWATMPEIRDDSGNLTVTYTDIRQDGFSGSGNIWTDPLFMDPRDYTLAPTSEGNYHLNPDSPVIDKGDSSGVPGDDIDGDSRPEGSGYDLGSDESVD